MFRGCSKLTSFNGNLSSLINGNDMFAGCSNLTSFVSTLEDLKCGNKMFSSCSLNEDSLNYIADYINDISSLDKKTDEDWTYEVLGETKTITKSYRGRIDIDYDESVSQDVRVDCGNKMIEKGWEVYFNNILYEFTDLSSPYDVSEANGYVPDAYKEGNDSWNTVVFKDIDAKGYVVEYVADGYAWGVKGTEN